MKITTSRSVMLMVAVVTVAAMQGRAQDATPPAPGDEWQQEDWSSVLPERGRSRRATGGFGGQAPMFGPADFQQRMQDMQDRIFGMQTQFRDTQRQAEQTRTDVIRQRLGINDQQWTRIKSHLDRIDQFKAAVNASIEPGGSNSVSTFTTGPGNFGGTWSGGFTTFGSSGPGRNWSRTETFGPGGSSATRNVTGELSDAEILCEELDNLLDSPGAAPTDVARKVTALRQAKQRAQTQLQRERTQLRKLVNPQQEAVLIVMGYLD